MSDPNEVSGNALEDYARSIVEPGSSQETSLQRALVELHNLSMPHLAIQRPNRDFLGRPQRQDIFYKLFLMINSEVVKSEATPSKLVSYQTSLFFRPTTTSAPWASPRTS